MPPKPANPTPKELDEAIQATNSHIEEAIRATHIHIDERFSTSNKNLDSKLTQVQQRMDSQDLLQETRHESLKAYLADLIKQIHPPASSTTTVTSTASPVPTFRPITTTSSVLVTPRSQYLNSFILSNSSTPHTNIQQGPFILGSPSYTTNVSQSFTSPIFTPNFVPNSTQTLHTVSTPLTTTFPQPLFTQAKRLSTNSSP